MNEFNDVREFKKSVITGTSILFLVQLLLSPIGILTSIVLARLLEPVHFGIYGILSFFISTGGQFSKFGLGAFLVQKQDSPTLAECRTVFTLRLLLSIGLCAILWAIFPLLSRYFNLSLQAAAMFKVISLVLLIEPFNSVSNALLQRNLLYKKLGIIDIISALSYQIPAILMAFFHLGAWSFILATVFATVVTAIACYLSAPWRLGLELDMAITKKELTFGSFFQSSALIAMVRHNIIAILGGIAFGPQAVGYLSWAYSTTMRISGIFNQVVGNITFPAVSRIQNAPEKIVAFFTKSIRYLMILTAPLMFILLSLRYEIIILVFKPKWLPAAGALVFFGLHHLAAHFTTIGDNTLKGMGMVKKNFIIMLIWAIATWAIAFLTMQRLAFNAIAFAALAGTLIPALWLAGIMGRLHPYRLTPIVTPVLLAGLVAVLVFLVKHALPMNIATLIALGTGGILLYAGLLFIAEGFTLIEELKELFALLK